MRMGITEPAQIPSNGKNKTEPVLKPKKKPSDGNEDRPPFVLTVGRISSNLIDAIYIPLLTQIAERQSEQYAESLLEYEESVKELNPIGDTTTSDDTDLEDILKEDDEEPPPPPPTPIDLPPKPSITSLLFASAYHRDELHSQILTPTSLHFTTPTPTTTRPKSRKHRASSSSSSTTPPWKIHANAAKFERHLDEKYGRLRPFLTRHPEIETFLRTTQRRFAKGEIGSPFRQGDPPMDVKASIILLFLLHRGGVRWEVMVLSSLFLLVGLEPWALVLAVAVGRWMMSRRKKRMHRGWLVADKKEIKVVRPYYAKVAGDVGEEGEEAAKKAKHDYLLKPVGEPISKGCDADYFTKEGDEGDEKYDTLVVGSGPATLYTAALLSRTGRTVLVLSPDKCASGSRTLFSSSSDDDDAPSEKDPVKNITRNRFLDVPFDVGSNHVAHTSRLQSFLAPALCTETDAQGGIRFATVGTEADGYTSDILSVPGMGTEADGECVPFPLRAGGVRTLAQDAALFFGDGWPTEEGPEGGVKTVGNSLTASYVGACATINASASQYYMNSAVDTENGMFTDKLSKCQYQEASVRWASGFMDQVLALNPHIRSLVAAMGMRGENLPPGKTSLAAHVTNVCAVAGGAGVGEGFTYPVGGPKALCHALAAVVEQNGGKIVTGVAMTEFLFHEEAEKEKEEEVEKEKEKEKKDDAETKEDTKKTKPRCYGVKLGDNRTISVGTHEDSAVVSMVGFLQTFLYNMNPDIRTKYGVPAGLPALSERRPLLHFLIGLEGDSTDLSLTGADWYRLPGASLARDEIDPTTGAVTLGTVGADLGIQEDNETDEDGIAATNDDPGGIADTDSNFRDKRSKKSKKPRRTKFVSGTSWMKVSFPSAKDPSFRERHPGISTCVVTVEADDDFVKQFDTTPNLFTSVKFGEGESTRLMERVINKDLLVNFPQLEGKLRGYMMNGPTRMGLSHTPHRYVAKGIQPTTGFPGLYMGGSDVTVGDSFSMSMIGGWMAANAVMKYGVIDHFFLRKNITFDLAQYLTSPKNVNGVEDIAVPFEPLVIPECDEEKDTIDEIKEGGEGVQTNQNEELTAESTKEE